LVVLVAGAVGGVDAGAASVGVLVAGAVGITDAGAALAGDLVGGMVVGADP